MVQKGTSGHDPHRQLDEGIPAPPLHRRWWVQPFPQVLSATDTVAAAMRRVASEPIKLSDGTHIPKGALTMVSLDKMKDKETFGDGSGYMPRRFLELRQKPGNE